MSNALTPSIMLKKSKPIIAAALLLSATLLLGACAGQSDIPPSTTGNTSDGNAAEVIAAEAEAPSYTVETSDWEGPKDEEGFVIITVNAKGPNKINDKYPQRVDLDANDAIATPQPRLKMADAALENPKRLVFTAPITPTAQGTHELTGTVRLSVCNDAQCHIQKVSVRARVTGQ